MKISIVRSWAGHDHLILKREVPFDLTMEELERLTTEVDVMLVDRGGSKVMFIDKKGKHFSVR